MLPFDVVKIIFYKCDFRSQIKLKSSSPYFYKIPIVSIPEDYHLLLTDDILLNFPQLENLDLKKNFNVTDSGVKNLKNLKGLVVGVNITDDGIAELTNLQILSSDFDRITDNGIAGLKNLMHLYISESFDITDKGISQLKNLNTLSINYNNNVTDNGIANLQNLTILEICDNNKITDSGIAKLKKLKNKFSL